LKQNKRKAREAIKHIIKGDYRDWLLNLKPNKNFIEKLKERGVNTDPLINGFSINVGEYTLCLETDPRRIILMGELFQTCLSLDGSFNYAVVPYLVDMNKKVIYMKDREGKIIARARLDISDEGNMRLMKVYFHRKIKNRAGYFWKFVEEFAKVTGLKRGIRGNFKSLHKLEEAEREYKSEEEEIELHVEIMESSNIEDVFYLTERARDGLENAEGFLEEMREYIASAGSFGNPLERLKVILPGMRVAGALLLRLTSDEDKSIEEQALRVCMDGFRFLSSLELREEDIEKIVKNRCFYYLRILYLDLAEHIEKKDKKLAGASLGFPVEFTCFILKNLNEELLKEMEVLAENRNMSCASVKEWEQASAILSFVMDVLIRGLKEKKISRGDVNRYLKRIPYIVQVQFPRCCTLEVLNIFAGTVLDTMEKLELTPQEEKFLKISIDKWIL